MSRSTPPPPPPLPAGWQERLERRARRRLTVTVWFRLLIPGVAGYAAGALTVLELTR